MITETQISQLQQQLEKSKEIAMQAMQYSGNLGVVLRFLETTFVCHDEQELVKKLLEINQSFSLDAIAKCYLDESSFTESISEEITPEEEKKMDDIRWDCRIYNEDKISIFSFDHISLFVRNMPIDDENKYGILKDILATMMNGIESRLKLLVRDKKIVAVQKQIIDLSDETMDKLENYLSNANKEAYSTVSDLLLDIKDTVFMLELGESHEKDIVEMLDMHGSLAQDMSQEGLKIDASLKVIKKSIENAMHEIEEDHQASNNSIEAEKPLSNEPELF